MNLWPWSRKARTMTLDQLIGALEVLYQTKSGISVTPENCERAPTVKAIVTAVSRRIAVSPVKVYQKGEQNGRETKTPLPRHPVSILLAMPNEYQDRITFWLDMGSQLVRYNNCHAIVGRVRGTPRRLTPLHAGETEAVMDDNNNVIYRTSGDMNGPYPANEIWHARGAGRDFLNGNSPVMDIREAIGLEIAAEEYGATFFGNGAVPMLVFQFLEGFKSWESDEEKDKFLGDIKAKLGGNRRHRAFFLPKGLELADKSKYTFDMDKAQFVDGRKYQRTVIAGAFGVPPHLVGDLERATYNNVEQQDKDFTINVVLPYIRMLESSLERDLLTRQELADGLVIRFNLDAIQRADFKSRQEGLQLQRLNGVINANEWRERENMNPLDEDEGGEDYWRPSNYELPGEEPEDTETTEVNDNAQ